MDRDRGRNTGGEGRGSKVRASVAVVAAALALSACQGDPTQLTDADEAGRVDFGVAGAQAGAHHAEGVLQAGGEILDSEFAIALPDSIGGLVVVSYDAETSDVFILQVQATSPGTYACADVTSGPPCHGRLLEHVELQSEGIAIDGLFDVVDGSVTLESVGPDRLKATFDAVFERSLGEGEPSTFDVVDGLVDVPWVSQPLTDGRLSCIIALTGATTVCST